MSIDLAKKIFEVRNQDFSPAFRSNLELSYSRENPTTKFYKYSLTPTPFSSTQWTFLNKPIIHIYQQLYFFWCLILKKLCQLSVNCHIGSPI